MWHRENICTSYIQDIYNKRYLQIVLIKDIFKYSEDIFSSIEDIFSSIEDIFYLFEDIFNYLKISLIHLTYGQTRAIKWGVHCIVKAQDTKMQRATHKI